MRFHAQLVEMWGRLSLNVMAKIAELDVRLSPVELPSREFFAAYDEYWSGEQDYRTLRERYVALAIQSISVPWRKTTITFHPSQEDAAVLVDD